MIKNISTVISDKFLDNNLISENQYKKTVFGFEVVISALLQISGLIIFGIVTNGLLKILCFMIFFSGSRSCSGGFHAKSCLDCFLLTIVVYYVSLIFSTAFVSFKFIFYLLLGIAFLLFYLYAPQDNPNKPFKDNEKQKYRKLTFKVVMIFYTILILFFIFTDYHIYCYLGSFGLLFEGLTLVPFLNKVKIIGKV